jgi:hypothetical protein
MLCRSKTIVPFSPNSRYSQNSENLGQVVRLITLAPEKQTVIPTRRPNADLPGGGRGRTAAYGHKGQPMVAPGLNHDPWPTAMASGRAS